MIFGRPTNLWLGLSTAIVGAITVTLVAAGFDPTLVATVSGAWGGVVGAMILVVANQPPTVVEGGTVNVQTPAGQPNAVVSVTASAASATQTVAAATAVPSDE